VRYLPDEMPSWLERTTQKPMQVRTAALTFTTIHGQPYAISKDDPDNPKSFEDLCIQSGFCLSNIAAKQGVSVVSLRRSFTKYAGISPKSWMMQHRVLLAVRLLRQGVRLPIIREKMNYHDHPHMAKEFKTVLGMAPKAMQQKLILAQNLEVA